MSSDQQSRKPVQEAEIRIDNLNAVEDVIKGRPLPASRVDIDELAIQCETVMRLATPPTISLDAGKVLVVLSEVRESRRNTETLVEALKDWSTKNISLRKQLAAAQEQNRRLAEENERTAVEKSDLMGANRRQIKVIGRLREMLKRGYLFNELASQRTYTDGDIDSALAKE